MVMSRPRGGNTVVMAVASLMGGISLAARADVTHDGPLGDPRSRAERRSC